MLYSLPIPYLIMHLIPIKFAALRISKKLCTGKSPHSHSSVSTYLFCSWLLVSVNECEGGDKDGDDDDAPGDVGEAEQGGGHNAVITTHCPPSVVQH